MPDTPRRPRIQWQDDTENLKNRGDAVQRILSGTPRPAAEQPAQPPFARNAEEGPLHP
ncbi:hypothetical protein [Nonomuraea gerenzanensis]|uniref:Uncharacterized protein n=1 Tax=Nonomuraea gerenzanensis TaxID=93944 RepID=A0A1M4EFD8_9ACTN|nr:hypothetical protein [Nonomuraea gerenzanensis]UBU08915.1 hypothetical protein LCN96_31580 [Nonomuraea gerenzanensis]SBO97293.1 hypothetical protein BN4615_P6809 [Nonomuraea gerenzanensis]